VVGAIFPGIYLLFSRLRLEQGKSGSKDSPRILAKHGKKGRESTGEERRKRAQTIQPPPGSFA